MHSRIIRSIAIIFCLLIVNTGIAQNYESNSESENSRSRADFKHSISVCPIAVVFGIYAVNYEYLVAPAHGIVVRFEYEDVPKSYTDANIESSGTSYSLNYRYHFSGEMNSIFLGAYARYRTYDGTGELESGAFDLTISDFTGGLNAGKKWAWNNGFNLTFALGYGLSNSEREASPTSTEIESIIDEFEKDYDFLSPFYGELSIGYSF